MTEQNSISVIKGNENKKNWFNRVYLCYEDTNLNKSTTYPAIKGFNCYKYDSFYNANYAWSNSRIELHKLEVRHTMIPMCRWVPEIFDRYILNWKLKQMYWGGQIFISKGYNRY